MQKDLGIWANVAPENGAPQKVIKQSRALLMGKCRKFFLQSPGKKDFCQDQKKAIMSIFFQLKKNSTIIYLPISSKCNSS